MVFCIELNIVQIDTFQKVSTFKLAHIKSQYVADMYTDFQDRR